MENLEIIGRREHGLLHLNAGDIPLKEKNPDNYEEVTCVNCGKKKTVLKSKRKIAIKFGYDGDNFFCNCKCFAQHKKRQQLVNCVVCNKQFEKAIRRINEEHWKSYQHYCSVECMRRGQSGEKVDHICEKCGKSFILLKSWISGGSRVGKYCSQDCFNTRSGLTEESISQIIKLHQEGCSYKYLSELFGVGEWAIGDRIRKWKANTS